MGVEFVENYRRYGAFYPRNLIALLLLISVAHYTLGALFSIWYL